MYKSTFLVDKNWGAFFIKLKCRCLRTGPVSVTFSAFHQMWCKFTLIFTVNG